MTQESTQINLNDISNVLSLLDIVTTRGAFRGPELSSVGLLRDKFAKFVEENTKKEEESKKESKEDE